MKQVIDCSVDQHPTDDSKDGESNHPVEFGLRFTELPHGCSQRKKN